INSEGFANGLPSSSMSHVPDALAACRWVAGVSGVVVELVWSRWLEGAVSEGLPAQPASPMARPSSTMHAVDFMIGGTRPRGCIGVVVGRFYPTSFSDVSINGRDFWRVASSISKIGFYGEPRFKHV
ncbi:MAG: hypothetical protein LC624_07000, partial [Halobacteriales archaeon]|nr:hypothetical protein [Halobacteriales archaeon]